MKSFQKFEPRTLDELHEVLASHGSEARILAGGTDLVVKMKHGLETPRYLVSLRHVQELKAVSFESQKGLALGSMVTLQYMCGHPAVNGGEYAVLQEAAESIGAFQHRVRGTVGGNICLDVRCWYYNQSERWRESKGHCLKAGGSKCFVAPRGGRCYAPYMGDLAPVLIALGARLSIISQQGVREVPLQELYTNEGLLPTGIKKDEVIKEVLVPRQPEKTGSTYLKFRIRNAIDFGLIGVATKVGILEKGWKATIVVKGVAPAPVVLHREGTEEMPGDDIFRALGEEVYQACHPLSREGGSPRFKRHIARTLACRGLRQAFDETAN